MHEFNWIDLGGLAAVCWVFVRVLGPVASALAKRLEGRRPPPPTRTRWMVHQLRDELEQLHERVDFLEWAVALRQPPAELPRTRTPV